MYKYSKKARKITKIFSRAQVQALFFVENAFFMTFLRFRFAYIKYMLYFCTLFL